MHYDFMDAHNRTRTNLLNLAPSLKKLIHYINEQQKVCSF